MAMMNRKVEKAINLQINRELYSSYLYLAMAAYFDNTDLKGFANWMKIQAREEVFHANKLYDYLIQRGGRAIFQNIEAPPVEWASPLAVFEGIYEHEQKVTGMINALVDIAIAEKDHASNNMLKWFVDEQVEEEDSAQEVIAKLKLMKDAPGGMFMLDNELGQRIFTPPADTAA